MATRHTAAKKGEECMQIKGIGIERDVELRR